MSLYLYSEIPYYALRRHFQLALSCAATRTGGRSESFFDRVSCRHLTTECINANSQRTTGMPRMRLDSEVPFAMDRRCCSLL